MGLKYEEELCLHLHLPTVSEHVARPAKATAIVQAGLDVLYRAGEDRPIRKRCVHCHQGEIIKVMYADPVRINLV